MKRIEAIVRPGKVRDVCVALEKVGHPGIMITEIEGHGKQEAAEQRWRGKMYKVDLMTKSRVELIVKDCECDGIIKAITAVACTGKIGDGKIFIHPVDDAVRIRTAERGDAAIE
ncbi:MAG: P-II family nitrogen regulator [Syntrophales bacterium]|nr:P-II family nitrogen regulator [Syntrophales bacterium]